jgi:hypothetical protein
MLSAASEDCNQRNENFQENFQEFIVAFYIWMGRIKFKHNVPKNQESKVSTNEPKSQAYEN